MTSNTTATQSWSEAYNVLIGDTAAPNSIALAACANQTRLGLNGIRLYYGSSYGMIREVGMDFGPGFFNPTWYQWMVFNGTDNMGGVGCALSNNMGHVYLRNRVGKALQEYHWSYINKDGWYAGKCSLGCQILVVSKASQDLKALQT